MISVRNITKLHLYVANSCIIRPNVLWFSAPITKSNSLTPGGFGSHLTDIIGIHIAMIANNRIRNMYLKVFITWWIIISVTLRSDFRPLTVISDDLRVISDVCLKLSQWKNIVDKNRIDHGRSCGTEFALVNLYSTEITRYRSRFLEYKLTRMNNGSPPI